jgi:hypothetical protein
MSPELRTQYLHNRNCVVEGRLFGLSMLDLSQVMISLYAALLLHCCYIVVRCYTVVTLLSHRNRTDTLSSSLALGTVGLT